MRTKRKRRVSGGESIRQKEHTHYLGISRSKAADVVVDLLKDEAPVHEGEASLWINNPQT